MELIDKAALLAEIKRSRERNPHKDPGARENHAVEHNHIARLVAGFPTAYDVDRVVGRLEEKALEHAITGQQYGADGYDMHEERERLIKQGIEEAIEIVESGGTRDHVREKRKGMGDRFECRAESAGYCRQWLRECVSWNNCHIEDYGAPCPQCIASSPLENERCDGCIHQGWKRDNYCE